MQVESGVGVALVDGGELVDASEAVSQRAAVDVHGLGRVVGAAAELLSVRTRSECLLVSWSISAPSHSCT